MPQKLWKIIIKIYIVEFPWNVAFSQKLQLYSPKYLNFRKKIFSGDVGKTCLKKVLKNYQKNVFSSVPFKNLEQSNPPTCNYAKVDSAANHI